MPILEQIGLWMQHILNNSEQFAPGVDIALYPKAPEHT